MPTENTTEKWTIETWQEKTKEELTKLKKEVIERIVDKMKKNQDNGLWHVWKKIVVDYLIDEWKRWDKFKDFIFWMIIRLLSTSSDKLKNLREEIKNVNTKEELLNLEKSIVDNISETQNNQKTLWSESTTSNQTTTSNSTTEKETSQSNESSKENVEPVVAPAKVWELAKVPESKKERIKRLFPSWVPKNKEEMKKYLTQIEMPVRTSDWQEDKVKLHVHAKLAEEIKAIFKEMYDKNIPVYPKKTWAYCWRLVRWWRTLSQHAYWSAIDVNYHVNGWVYGKTDRSSPYFNGRETVAIRKKHGFFRWWDWSARKNDPMHFWFYNG